MENLDLAYQQDMTYQERSLNGGSQKIKRTKTSHTFSNLSKRDRLIQEWEDGIDI